MDPLLLPDITLCFGFCLFVILAEKCIVSIVISLDWGWMRAVRALDYGVDHEPRDCGAVGVAGDCFYVDNFFGHYDDPLGCAHAFWHHAEISPAMRVAFGVGALHVDNRDIRIQRSHCPQRFLRREWGKDLIEKMIAFGAVAAERAFCRQERNAHGSGLQRERYGEVGHVEDLHAILLDGAAEIIDGAHHYVAYPGGDDFLNASGADQLIEESVGNGADQGQVAFGLTDDFVAGGKGDHLLHLQAERDGRTIGDELGDGVMHGAEFRHHSSRFTFSIHAGVCGRWINVVRLASTASIHSPTAASLAWRTALA